MKNKQSKFKAYTQWFKLNPKNDSRSLKSLILKVIIISIFIGAACALAYGIDIAKEVIK